MSATPVREPTSLSELPAEHFVLEALRNAGLPVSTVGQSLDEAALGVVVPARAFIVEPGSAGAQVLFIRDAGVGRIELCADNGNAPGRTVTKVSVNGQRVSANDSTTPVFYLASSDYFVITRSVAVRDALATGLGVHALSAGPCGTS